MYPLFMKSLDFAGAALRSTITALVFFYLINASASAADSEDVKYPLTIEDDLGNNVVVEKKPTRIISCALFLDEILMCTADKKNILGVSTFALDPEISNIADDAASIPNKLVFNVESLIALEPDVLLVADWSPPDGVKLIRSAGIPVCIIKFPASIDGIRRTIRRIARIVGEKEKGDLLVSNMDAELSKNKKALCPAKIAKKLTVLDYDPTYGSSFGRGSLWDDVVAHAGLLNAASSIETGKWGTAILSREKIIELDPDIIILPAWVYGDPSGADRMLKNFTEDPLFKDLRAVRDKRVYRLSERYRYCGSQYVVSGVSALSRLAYPGLFGARP
jgi:iron complex transport system substrate-binding protein